MTAVVQRQPFLVSARFDEAFIERRMREHREHQEQQAAADASEIICEVAAALDYARTLGARKAKRLA